MIHSVGGVCNFLGSVSSQKFEAWTSITVTCYSSVLFRKQRKIQPGGVRACCPKDKKRREASWSNRSNFGSSFCLLPPSQGLPYVNWASQECSLFYLRASLRSLDLPLFYFPKLFPFLSFSHHHSGLLFPVLTT